MYRNHASGSHLFQSNKTSFRNPILSIPFVLPVSASIASKYNLSSTDTGLRGFESVKRKNHALLRELIHLTNQKMIEFDRIEFA